MKISRKNTRVFRDADGAVDLDLTYVTSRLVALSFPANRAARDEMRRFFESRHENQVMLYNLCEDDECLTDSPIDKVKKYSFQKSCPCPFSTLTTICEDIAAFLAKDELNVAAVACKSGKGRAGLVVCAYLVHCGFSAEDALEIFSQTRTTDQSGITTPSQQRYVHYYSMFRRGGLPPLLQPRLLVCMRLVAPPNVDVTGIRPYFRILFARGIHDPKAGCSVATALMYDHKRVSQQFQESYAENRPAGGGSNSKRPSPTKAQPGRKSASKFSIDQVTGGTPDDGTLPADRQQKAGGSTSKSRGGSPPRKSDGKEAKALKHNSSPAGTTFDFASGEAAGGERDSGMKSGAQPSAGQGNGRQGRIFKLRRFKDAHVAELACLEQVIVQEDVVVQLFHRADVGTDPLLCSFWFHTGFVKRHHFSLARQHLDKAFKDKRFGSNFRLEMYFN